MVKWVDMTIEIKWKVIAVFNLAHLSQRISFFLNIPQYTDKHVPSWHVFKNFAAVLIGLLHLQPFMNSHFHFLIIVEP